ncbi:MAG: hypothetical protein QM756_36765 [Polyangiaceae bacterium]
MKRASLSADTRGAIFVEQLIAFLPLLFFFLASWQLIELCAADLILKRAASVAARAAVVVLPDDPMFYGGAPVNSFAGARKTDVMLATAAILATSPHFSRDFSVSLSGTSGNQALTARVRAPFHCFAGWVNLVCGGPVRVLEASARHVYQGAPFDYAFVGAAPQPSGGSW